MEHFLGRLETYLQTSIPLSFGVAYLGGLFASLTPCVYPMIPITAGIVGQSNLGGSRRRGFFLSVLYVTGMAVTYTALGIFAAATGRFFGTINTHPLTFFLIGNLILFLGLIMLDVFQIPTFAPNLPSRLKGGPCVFLIGMSSGLIAGPCTAPVLAVLLAYVASTGNLLLGAGLLFTFAFGMGALLIAIGTFSGLLASLPRSGPWMTTIKKTLGLLMIALAEYFFFKSGQLII